MKRIGRRIERVKLSSILPWTQSQRFRLVNWFMRGMIWQDINLLGYDSVFSSKEGAMNDLER